MGHAWNKRYEKRDGLFCLFLGDAIVAEMDRVAIGYSRLDDGSFILHEHGTQDSVFRWLSWAHDNYHKYSDHLADKQLRCVVDGTWDVDELNRVISDNGCLAAYLKRLKADRVTNQAVPSDVLVPFQRD